MNRFKRWNWALLACILAVSFAIPAYGTRSDISDAKDKATSLQEEKNKVENTLKNLEGLKKDMAVYVRELDTSLLEIGQELSALNGQIHDKELEISRSKAALAEAKQVEEKQYEAMKLRIKYMYEVGTTTYIDILFQARDVSQLLSRAEYISRIMEYDKKKMEEFRIAKRDIADREKVLETEREELTGLMKITEAKQASVQRLLSAKSRELRRYENEISSAEGRLSEYDRDIKAQEDKIKNIEAEIRRREEEARKAAEAAGKKYNTTSIGNINFIWPCPSGRRITSEFGGRSSPAEGASSNHQGMDIGAATGNSIIAAAAGEVIISTYSYSAGNYITINHGGGVYTTYMHCSELLVSVGDKVTQGQEIAKVGSTGVSTGPHLHFGIRVNGTYVNPAGYVSP